MKLKFRHELKYLINYGDQELLKQRLNVVARLDPHAGERGEYKIRSLYFDDLNATAFHEKDMGILMRKKYRIRIYNDSDSVIKLECKMKQGAYINKRSASLSRREFDRIMDGDYDFLLDRKEPLCGEFYYKCKSAYLRPRLIVDYDREPYMYDAGEVRITFDKQVRTSAFVYDFFEPELPESYILEPGKLILEVKFTEFLPDIIRDILPVKASECTAVSKYGMSFLKDGHLFALSKYI